MVFCLCVSAAIGGKPIQGAPTLRNLLKKNDVALYFILLYILKVYNKINTKYILTFPS